MSLHTLEVVFDGVRFRIVAESDGSVSFYIHESDRKVRARLAVRDALVLINGLANAAIAAGSV